MKTSPRPEELLVQALTRDANELPLAAAAQARSRRRLRRTVSSSAAVVLLVALGFWFSTRPAPNQASHAGPNNNFVHSGAIVPGPAVAGPAEKKLLDDLADTPLLVVRNSSGHLRRVYVFEGAR